MKKDSSVVITGLGLVLPSEARSHWIFGEEQVKIANEEAILSQKLKRRGLKYKDHATKLALLAAKQALIDAGMPTQASEQIEGEKFGVVVSSNLGNTSSIVKVINAIQEINANNTSPMDLPNVSSNVIASTIAIWYGFKSLNLLIANGSTSGANAIWIAANAIRARRAKRMLVVGVETTNATVERLTKESRKQISKDNDPKPLVNISAALVLEKFEAAWERNARVYCRIGQHQSAGNEQLKYSIEKIIQGSSMAEISLWLIPRAKHFYIKNLNKKNFQSLFLEKVPEMKNLSDYLNETYGALGVIQGVAAANWIQRHQGRNVLATCGSNLGDNSMSSILYEPSPDRKQVIYKNKYTSLLVNQNDHNWKIRYRDVFQFRIELANKTTLPNTTIQGSIVFIHGMIEDWNVWEPLQKQLQNFDLWFLKLPWDSSQGKSWGDKARPEDWISAGLGMLPKIPDIVVAHSFSANALLEYFLKLKSKGPKGGILISPFFRKKAEDIDWDVLYHYVVNFLKLIMEAVKIHETTKKFDQETIFQISKKIRERLGVYGWYEFLRLLLRTPKLNLTSLSIPFLVITGEKDFASEPIHCHELAGALGNGKIFILQNCGHFCMLEKPLELAAAIKNFILDVSSTSI